MTTALEYIKNGIINNDISEVKKGYFAMTGDNVGILVDSPIETLKKIKSIIEKELGETTSAVDDNGFAPQHTVETPEEAEKDAEGNDMEVIEQDGSHVISEMTPEDRAEGIEQAKTIQEHRKNNPRAPRSKSVGLGTTYTCASCDKDFKSHLSLDKHTAICPACTKR